MNSKQMRGRNFLDQLSARSAMPMGGPPSRQGLQKQRNLNDFYVPPLDPLDAMFAEPPQPMGVLPTAEEIKEDRRLHGRWPNPLPDYRRIYRGN